jgi:hypothetical protein
VRGQRQARVQAARAQVGVADLLDRGGRSRGMRRRLAGGGGGDGARQRGEDETRPPRRKALSRR